MFTCYMVNDILTTHLSSYCDTNIKNVASLIQKLIVFLYNNESELIDFITNNPFECSVQYG